MGAYEDLTLAFNKILVRLDEQEEKLEWLRRALDTHEETYIHQTHFDY
jgi:hypothetical protein